MGVRSVFARALHVGVDPVLRIGVGPDQLAETTQFVMLTNGVALLVQIASLISMFVYLAVGPGELVVLSAATIVLAGAAFVFNTLRLYLLAGVWLTALTNAVIFAIAILVGAAPVHSALYFMCALPFFFFGLRQMRALGGTLALGAIVFIWLTWPDALPEPWLELDAYQLRVVDTTISGLAWLTLLAIIAHFALVRDKNTERLGKALLRAEVASEAKSAFLANTTHELRTPLGAILGYADLLLAPGTSPDERANFISTIRRNGRHLLELVDQVLDHAKIEAGQFDISHDPCSPERIVADVEALMQVRAGAKKVDLQIVYETRVPELIETDALRVRQILVNLIGNAVKFTEEGDVVLRVSLVEVGQQAELRFAVEDSGPGIAPEKLHEMFEPFTQADMSTQRVYGGTGLGLSISKQLAELLGGRLEATSVLGRGSTFTFVMQLGPVSQLGELVDARLSLEPTMIRARTHSGMHGIRVLVAEDGFDNQRLFELYLQRAGADPLLASNGAKAVAAYQESLERDDPFDIILMDMQMPELDGYEATRKLREMGCELPIFALTAHAMVGARERCLAAGCDQYFVKPVDFDKLFSAMLNTIDERAGYGEGMYGNQRPRQRRAVTSSGRALPLTAAPERDGSWRDDMSAAASEPMPGPVPDSVPDPVPDSERDARADFEAKLASMTRDFIARLPEQIEELRALFVDDDLEQLRFVAHRLKGTAGVYGLDRVSELAGHIERAVDQGKSGSDINDLVRELTELAI